jgi:hypothetical protein
MRRKRRRGAAVMRFIECGDAIRRKGWLGTVRNPGGLVVKKH